jgi:hypothetical protein
MSPPTAWDVDELHPLSMRPPSPGSSGSWVRQLVGRSAPSERRPLNAGPMARWSGSDGHDGTGAASDHASRAPATPDGGCWRCARPSTTSSTCLSIGSPTSPQRSIRQCRRRPRQCSARQRMGRLARHVAEVAQSVHPELAVPADLHPTILRMSQEALDLVSTARGRSSPWTTPPPADSTTPTTR